MIPDGSTIGETIFDFEVSGKGCLKQRWIEVMNADLEHFSNQPGESGKREMSMIYTNAQGEAMGNKNVLFVEVTVPNKYSYHPNELEAVKKSAWTILSDSAVQATSTHSRQDFGVLVKKSFFPPCTTDLDTVVDRKKFQTRKTSANQGEIGP
ncbi:hypothetical protein Y032_0006g2780 [Ancylostoma ceylanicum]|uniref:Uncharacterized protein n=1 Tax=Ancylostoma ceylanicum TaxID=53326 RepID=A0A016VNY0_9BILA|nr:hypothetical protein Y032_0006g2780 [Ancylostoma ceylanicum]